VFIERGGWRAQLHVQGSQAQRLSNVANRRAQHTLQIQRLVHARRRLAGELLSLSTALSLFQLSSAY
jgi:hypothetical protein